MEIFIINQYRYLICFIVIGLTALMNYAVNGACSKSEKKLWAYTNPSTERFTDTYKTFMSSDRGAQCRWVITSSDDNSYIQLKFSNFELKNSTKSDKGDCLEIYDGEEDKTLDKLCDKVPQELYTSSDGDILVIYRRGEVVGDRRFTMIYSSHSVMSKEKLIQIAGIVGAILAGLGVTYVILRVTKCCKCLRKKGSTDNNGSDTTTRERDRLVRNVEQGGDNAENIQNNTTNHNSSQPLAQPTNNGAVSPSENQDGVASDINNININDNGHDSDTDSLHALNEPPPSYESLYLNELGESVTPPKYSPPQHQGTHPPRRVNTVN